MKKTARYLIIFLVIGIIAAVSKPSSASFDEHIAETFTTDEGTIAGDVMKWLNKSRSLLTQDYNDYTFFATAEIEWDGKKYKYFGAFKKWVKYGED